MVYLDTYAPLMDDLIIREIEADSIIIPTKVADGLDSWKCKVVKQATASIQSSSIVMGRCIYSTAKELHQLKSLIPKRNWIAFLDSGMIPIKRATALNLVKSWEVFLSKGELSDGELANVSAQSLGKIARANNPEVVKTAVKRLKAGERLTEKEVDRMLETAKGLMDNLDEDNAPTSANQLMDIVVEVTKNNESHKLQEEAMVKKIGKLELEVQSFKKKVADLTQENSELKAELKSLKMNLKSVPV
jgi:hypothetical protein